MKTELYRLSEDEISLVHLYRTLSMESKAAMLALCMGQSESAAAKATDNVVTLIRDHPRIRRSTRIA